MGVVQSLVNLGEYESKSEHHHRHTEWMYPRTLILKKHDRSSRLRSPLA